MFGNINNLVALGEFDDNLEFYREIDWFVFCMFTIFNITVLLNLLISIIGEIYQKYSAIYLIYHW